MSSQNPFSRDFNEVAAMEQDHARMRERNVEVFVKRCSPSAPTAPGWIATVTSCSRREIWPATGGRGCSTSRPRPRIIPSCGTKLGANVPSSSHLIPMTKKWSKRK